VVEVSNVILNVKFLGAQFPPSVFFHMLPSIGLNQWKHSSPSSLAQSISLKFHFLLKGSLNKVRPTIDKFTLILSVTYPWILVTFAEFFFSYNYKSDNPSYW
jgi:hypothetical protein